MILSTFTDENGHTTVTIKIGCEMESMSLGQWSRLIATPQFTSAPTKPTPVRVPQ